MLNYLARLGWSHGDARYADKIREAQELIASMPKPAHVPRPPRPVQIIDEGPLVLVETRKNLGNLKMPFDS
jgi:ribonuclease E